MNREKDLERLKRMYDYQTREYEELQAKYNELLAKDDEPIEEVIALMQELRDIKDEWTTALDGLYKYKDEYQKLITELKDFRHKLKRGKL